VSNQHAYKIFDSYDKRCEKQKKRNFDASLPVQERICLSRKRRCGIYRMFIEYQTKRDPRLRTRLENSQCFVIWSLKSHRKHTTTSSSTLRCVGVDIFLTRPESNLGVARFDLNYAKLFHFFPWGGGSISIFELSLDFQLEPAPVMCVLGTASALSVLMQAYAQLTLLPTAARVVRKPRTARLPAGASTCTTCTGASTCSASTGASTRSACSGASTCSACSGASTSTCSECTGAGTCLERGRLCLKEIPARF